MAIRKRKARLIRPQWSSLHEAARQGDVESVRSMARLGRVNKKDASGNRPLHEAANKGVARELVKAGARLHVEDQHKRTPLHRAVLDEHPKVAVYLIDHMSKIDLRDDEGRTPLHWAAIKDDAATAVALLRAGAKQRVKDNDGNTPMRLAVTHGSMDFVCGFLKAGM